MGALPFCHLSFRVEIRKAADLVEPKTLGDAIHTRRLELGMMQKEAALRIGRDKMSIINWEKNHTQLRVNHMAAIVRFLGYVPNQQCDTLALRLVAHRTTRGVTQKGFAAELGIDRSTLARWERGEREPTGRYLATVGKILG